MIVKNESYYYCSVTKEASAIIPLHADALVVSSLSLSVHSFPCSNFKTAAVTHIPHVNIIACTACLNWNVTGTSVRT